jgi:hypothetical protein
LPVPTYREVVVVETTYRRWIPKDRERERENERSKKKRGKQGGREQERSRKRERRGDGKEENKETQEKRKKGEKKKCGFQSKDAPSKTIFAVDFSIQVLRRRVHEIFGWL